MANSPRCRRIRRLLPLLAGDTESSDLRWDDRRMVERHLIGCPSCRARRDSLESAVGVLRLSALVAPVSTEPRSVWPELSRQIRGTRHPKPAHWFGLGFGGSVGLAASLLLLGTVLGLLGSRLAALPSRPPTASAYVDATPVPQPVTPSSALAAQPAPPVKDTSRISLEIDSKGTAAHLLDPQRSQ